MFLFYLYAQCKCELTFHVIIENCWSSAKKIKKMKITKKE